MGRGLGVLYGKYIAMRRDLDAHCVGLPYAVEISRGLIFLRKNGIITQSTACIDTLMALVLMQEK